MIIIEKEIPIPPSRGRTEFADAAAKMESGESAVFESCYLARKLAQALSAKSKHTCTRKLSQGGWRVWCLGNIEK